MLTVKDTINRINKNLEDPSRRSLGSLDNALISAVRYLQDYDQMVTIRNEIKNPKLTWDMLTKEFGRPIRYYREESDRYCKASGWMILHELTITESGHFVIGTDGVQIQYEYYEFYRYEG